MLKVLSPPSLVEVNAITESLLSEVREEGDTPKMRLCEA